MTKPIGPVRPGHHTLTPYLVVERADPVIAFIKQAFGAEELDRATAPDGRIQNVQVRIGDSMLELGESRDPWKPMRAALHLYLDDTDATYRRALEAGGRSLYEPADMSYGERSAGVEDPAGNYWFIATYTGRATG